MTKDEAREGLRYIDWLKERKQILRFPSLEKDQIIIDEFLESYFRGVVDCQLS